MSSAKTHLERAGGVAILTLADPAKRNAIGRQLASELVERAASLEADGDVRALVVTGEGSAFCAGADLPDVFGEQRGADETRAMLASYYECFLRIRALPFPTIAAVNGPAIGAGLNLAMACDLRIASPGARFGATFTRIGLHPGGGCSFFLVEALGRERALRLLLEGGTLDGAEAVRAGLAAALEDDPLAAALELAQRIAALEPELARNVLQAVAIAARDGFEATLAFETAAQAESTANPRFREFVASFE